jgi:hypothetical protein
MTETSIVAAAKARRPDAGIFVLPGKDGQYSDHATDVVALLEEAGVVVDYATDPMTAGVHGEKSAETILPALVIAFGNAASIASAIDGVIWVIKHFAQDRPRHRVVVDVTFEIDPDGTERRSVHVDTTGPDIEEVAKLLKQAGKVWPDDS